MFSHIFFHLHWVWLWVIVLLLNLVGVFRAYRRADRLTLRQAAVAAVGAVCLIVSYWAGAASTALIGVGFALMVVSSLDGLFSGKGRAA